MNDPNLWLAAAMVKSIYSLVNNDQTSQDEPEQKKQESSHHQQPASQSIERSSLPQVMQVLELSPIQELQDRIQQKKLLSREEMKVITQVLSSKYQNISSKSRLSTDQHVGQAANGDATQVKDILSLAYNAILNTHSYTQCQNFLDRSAHSRLTVEALNLARKVLEILQTPNQDPHIYNQTLPIILNYLQTLANKDSYDEAQFQYLREANLRLPVTSLTHLNQYLSDLAPELYGLKKKAPTTTSVKLEEPVSISLPQNISLGEDESLDKALEFVPVDYSTMTNMLAQHLQTKLLIREEDSQAMNDEQQPAQVGVGEKEYIETCRECIQQHNLIEMVDSAVEKLIDIANQSTYGFATINTQLIQRIYKSYDILGLKTQQLAAFITKDLPHKIFSAMHNLLTDSIEKAQQMEIQQDQMVQQKDKINIAHEYISLAKSLEILLIIGSELNNTLDVTGKINESLQEAALEFINYKLVRIIMHYEKKKIQEIQPAVLSISQSFIQYILHRQKEAITPQNLEMQMILISSIVRLLKDLHNTDRKHAAKKSIDKPKTPVLEKALSQPIAGTQSTRIKTRNQIKKEQSSAQKEQQPSQNEESKQENTNFLQVEKFVKASEIFKLNVDDVLKHSLSLIIMMVPKYLQQPDGEINLHKAVFRNLLQIGFFASPLINRIVYGIQSEFTKSSLKYSQDSVRIITQLLTKQLSNIKQSNTLTVFTMKLLVLLKNTSLPQQLLDSILAMNASWVAKKGAIKNQIDLYDGQNLRKYLLFTVLVLQISHDLQYKQSLLRKIIDSLSQETTNFYLLLHQTQLLAMNSKSINKFKPLIYSFLTKMYSDSENESNMQVLIADIDKTLTQALVQKDALYDRDILKNLAEKLNLKSLTMNVQKTMFGRNEEAKAQTIYILKQVIRLSNEAGQKYDQNFNELLSLFQQNHSDLFLNSQVEQAYFDKTQTILYLFQDDLTLFDDDLSFIQSQLNLIKVLASYSNEMQVKILQGYLNQEQQEMLDIGGNVQLNSYASLIFDFIKLTNVSIKNKVQETIPVKQGEDQKMAQTIVDQQLMVKTIASLQSKGEQSDILYNHIISRSSSKPDHQALISTNVLLKSIYNNLCSISNSCKDLKTYKDSMRDIVLTLIQVKLECPFLEFNETSSAFDHDQNDKLLQKAMSISLLDNHNNIITNHKDYMRIRQLNVGVQLLNKARLFFMSLPSANYMSQEQKEQRKLVQKLTNEVANGCVCSFSLKSQEDAYLLLDYFRGFDGILQTLLKLDNNQDLPLLLWDLAFQYLDQSHSDSQLEEDIGLSFVVESKGGVTFNVSTATKKRQARKAAGGLFQQSTVNKKDEEKTEEEGKKEEKRPTQISMTASILIMHVVDLMQSDSTNGYNNSKLTFQLRQAFLKIQTPESNQFLHNLTMFGQTMLIKKIFSALLSNSIDSNQKKAISKRLEQLIITELQNQLVTEKTIMQTIEYFQYLTDSNIELLQFITTNILPLPILEIQVPAKLKLLELMCQLGLSQFSQVQKKDNEADVLKFNANTIQEKRKKAQLELIQEQAKKKEIERTKAAIEEKEQLQGSLYSQAIPQPNKTDGQEGIEGFKQEKLIKEDEEGYEKYMERPEDVCTYTQTKKEFKTQHWYFCYTCGFTGSSGVCGVCVRKCHKGHQVAYSKKSNFFCDCGDSGKCHSLQAKVEVKPNIVISRERPETGRRRNREDANLDYAGRGGRNRPNRGGRSIFGEPPRVEEHYGFRPPPGSFRAADFLSKYGLPNEDEDDDEASLIYSHIGGMLERPPNFEQHSFGGLFGQPISSMAQIKEVKPRQFQIMSDSSDEERHDQQEYVQLQREDVGDFKSISKIMQLIKEKDKEKQGFSKLEFISKQPDSPSSVSQMSLINPFEDPLSEASITPMQSQKFFTDQKLEGTAAGLKITTASLQDEEMEDVELLSQIKDKIKQESSQFDMVFKYLIDLIEQSQVIQHSQDQDQEDEIMSSVSSPIKSVRGAFKIPKNQIILTQDLTQHKKSIKEGTITFKLSEQSKQSCNYNLNLLQMIDSNRDGLVAICEKDNEVVFYASSQFFEEGVNLQAAYEQFNFQSKEGQALNKIESYTQFGFNPLLLRFNPAYPNYLAVAGSQKLDILTISKQGKVLQKLSVDLLLEVLSNDLTLLNVKWLPGSQTSIAVATREFVKIFNLSEDNMSPTHNIMIMNGYISDFTFGKTYQADQQGNRAKSTIYVSSKSGEIYYQQFTFKQQSVTSNILNSHNKDIEMQQADDNSDMLITSIVQYDSQLQVTPQNACLALHYSENSDLLFCTFQGGHTIAGSVNHESGLYSGYRLNIHDEQLGNKNLGISSTLSKNGENIVAFKEIGIIGGKDKNNKGKAYITAISRKINALSSGVPLLLEISENQAQLNIMRPSNSGSSFPACYGLTFAKNSNKVQNAHRLLVISSDGSQHTYSIKSYPDNAQNQNETNLKQENIHKLLNQNGLIKKSDLPKEVKMPVNFFEKMKNVYLDANLRSKLQLTGDIVNYFKTSKATFEQLSKGPNSPVIVESQKKSVKMNIKLEINSDHVLTGLRMKLDFTNKSQNGLQFKLFNRVVKLKAKTGIWFDIPFCDAEVLYCQSQNLETELITDDVAASPIKIFQVEFFAVPRKEFQMREKLKRLEKLSEDSTKPINDRISVSNASQEEQVSQEMLKTKGVPLVTWKEKEQMLNSVHSQEAKQILCLDLLTQYLCVNPDQDHQKLAIILGKLKQLLGKSISEGKSKGCYQISAIKRCLNQILQVLKPKATVGDSLNYQTIKDQLSIEIITSKIAEHQNGMSLTFAEAKIFVLQLAKICNKRFYQCIQILKQHPNLALSLSQIYLQKFTQSDSTTHADILAIFTLLTAALFERLNRNINVLPSTDISDLMRQAFECKDYDDVISQMNPFFMHSDEQVQKISLSSILKLLVQYSRTFAKTLTYKQLPLFVYSESSGQPQHYNFMIIDISPFLLRNLLTLILFKQDQADIAYSLAYKVIKMFESTCMQINKQIIQDYSNYIVQPICDFINQTVLQIQTETHLYEAEHKQRAQYLYTNLTFINLLMHNVEKKENRAFKIKNHKLCLDKTIRDSVLHTLGQRQNLIFRMSEWVVSILKEFDKGFKEGKCSYRTKYEDGIPVGVQENDTNDNVGALGVKLLKPIAETQPWKWHPIFIQTDSIFEILDRKIPVQLLLFTHFVLLQSDLSQNLEDSLIETIKTLCLKKPANEFLQELGEQVVRDILTKRLNRDPSEQKDEQTVKQQVEKQLEQEVKSFVVFQEFYDAYEPIFLKFVKQKGQMTFNTEFQIHNILSDLWAKVSTSPLNWNFFVTQQYRPSNSSQKVVNMLIDSAFSLNEESAVLCLAICSLAFSDDKDEAQTQATAVQNVIKERNTDIFKVHQAPLEQRKQICLIKTENIDIQKLIDTLLLGRNKKQLRVLSSIIIKGIYETNNSQLVNLLFAKLPTLKSYGVNSQEFTAVFSYIVNRECQQNNLSHNQIEFLTSQVQQEISRNNTQISAHPNLEIYATLQRLTSSFSAQNMENEMFSEQNLFAQRAKEAQDIVLNKAGGEIYSMGYSGKNKKIQNPYILEDEACSKCYEQKSMPFTSMRLNEVKSEAKFTDSTMIYKFNQTYLFKQIQMTLQEIKGLKVIKALNIYVNNKQGVDLADMRNNWSFWKKVKSVEVDVAQRNIIIDFALPINASNMLIELSTVNLTKPLSGKDKPSTNQKGNQHEGRQINVIGIDTVIQSLPKKVINKIGVQTNSIVGKPEIIQNNIFEKENMNCPRCGKQVQGKHGICNSCGENALQCTFCRNINYEKPDGYLCNECGFSRFAKFDFSFVVKQGNAAEKIETDDQKNAANQRIESHLQVAQTCYSNILKKRQIIASLVPKINQGQDSANAKVVQDLYGEDCADQYQKMMRSLNSIKIIKNEIEIFAQGGITIVEEDQHSIRLGQKQNDQQQTTCFSCIQEYLKSQLNFLEKTALNLSSQYQAKGIVDILFQNNLNMHTASLQNPALQAICALIRSDEQRSLEIMSKVAKNIENKKNIIPSYLLSQNISSDSSIILSLLKDQLELRNNLKDNFFTSLLASFWNIYFSAFAQAKSNSSIAEQIVQPFTHFIKSNMKPKTNQDDKNKEQEGVKDLKNSLLSEELTLQLSNLFKINAKEEVIDYFGQSLNQYFENKNFIIQALILPSSQNVRNEAKDIIHGLVHFYKDLEPFILQQMLTVVDEVLKDCSLESDNYFDILTLLLSKPITKEMIDANLVFVQAFNTLFELIDLELNNLVSQENQKQQLGLDGLMPQLSTGKLLSRLVTLISSMVKESAYLKNIISNNVSLVIKSFLKIRKLNLIKNKLTQSSEIELEKMFKELHSEKEQDKEKFILECIKLIEAGDCDLQEMRFLFEEICKVVDPIKPDPEYFLNLKKAQSQEFYFRGSMAKNPYTSTSLGKTMADVRIKICKEMELSEPELVELLVFGKIISVDLSIKQVYEQVYWPAICKQRDPESYEIPSIDDAPKSSLHPMDVTYRLMGIDGEATEDRVETLQDGSEAEMSQSAIDKKYGVTNALTQLFESKSNPGTQINGINVLLNVLQNFGSLQKQRYLAEWLFKLISYANKIKSNRQEFIKNKQTTGLFAKRLFESVGMQSSLEGQKEQTLFDHILQILEIIVTELNLFQDRDQSLDAMDIDTLEENIEATTHVEIFINIMSDASNTMIQNMTQLDKTSKKIRAVSKILPFLINKDDNSALNIIGDFITKAISLAQRLDQLTNQIDWTNKNKFQAQFDLERVSEILESTPVQKNFLKDQLLHCQEGQVALKQMIHFMLNESLKQYDNENIVYKYKHSNQNILKILNGLIKNHPESQLLVHQLGLVEVLYKFTQNKFKDKTLTILAQDIIENLTNKAHQNDQTVFSYLYNLINAQNDEKKKLAQKKREEVMRQMQNKKNVNKFLKQIEQVSLQEENGPKCVVCLEGYCKKPTEVLGMYVFSKRLKIYEMSENGSGFVQTHGYQTVTHSNYIHFLCHQNAYKADQQSKQPKKEWEGAIIRNDHTKCNNLFPLRGGNLSGDSYQNVIDRYFAIMQKTVSQSDADKVKVVLHDFKMIIKRLANEDSFSRDSQGGGPEHNMHLIPFMMQMTAHLIQLQDQYKMADTDSKKLFTYKLEKKISDFLEEALKQKQDFMSKMEEEKKFDEIEEEEKFSEEMSSQQDDGEEGDSLMDQMNNFKLDQLACQIASSIIFCQMPVWELYKPKFLSVILCTIAGMKEDRGLQDAQLKPTGQQTEYATGKKVLTIAKQTTDSDIVMQEEFTQRRRRLSSDNKIEVIQRSLFRIRPLLIMMRLVDVIKQRWDGKRLGVLSTDQMMRHEEYLKKINDEFIGKGSLEEVIKECDEIFKEYKDRMLKTASVEEFLQDLGMLEPIVKEHGSVESFIMSHF